jgi:hypothetical protein
VVCAGLELDGRRWTIAATPAKGQTTLHDSAKVFSDEAAAKAWRGRIAGWRVDYLVKLAAKPVAAGATSISVEVVGWRIANACDGSIIASSEPAAPIRAPAGAKCPSP